MFKALGFTALNILDLVITIRYSIYEVNPFASELIQIGIPLFSILKILSGLVFVAVYYEYRQKAFARRMMLYVFLMMLATVINNIMVVKAVEIG